MVRRHPAPAPGEPLVAFQQVSKRFSMRREQQRSFQDMFIRLARRKKDDRTRDFWALRDVSLVVQPGDCLGVIGPNGGGKSTLLKLIAGILEPTLGSIITFGRITSLLELGAGFHWELTGRENIYLNGSVYGLNRRQMRDRAEAIIEFSELDDFIDVPIKHYSSGMYVRLGFAVAMQTEPDLLLVDEVLAVGDTAFQRKCLDSIQKFRDSGGTLLFVSHDLNAVQALCTRAIWMEDGQLRAEGQPSDVVAAYLNAVNEQQHRAAANSWHSPEEGKHRFGTGKVKITGVEIRSGADPTNNLFVTGSALEVRLHYHAAQRITEPVFGLAIHHQNGTHLCGPNTQAANLVIPSVAGEGVVIYHVPKLPLLEGIYLISVSVHNRADTEMYDYHDRAYSFRVVSGASSEPYGIVAMEGTWQIALTATTATDIVWRYNASQK